MADKPSLITLMGVFSGDAASRIVPFTPQIAALVVAASFPDVPTVAKPDDTVSPTTPGSPSATPAAPAGPVAPPPGPTAPVPIKVAETLFPPTADLVAAVMKPGTFVLAEGAQYLLKGPLNPVSGVTLKAANGSRIRPRVSVAQGYAFRAAGRTDITVDGIEWYCTGKPTDAAFKLLNVHRVVLHNNRITRFWTGGTTEGVNGQRSSGFSLLNNIIDRCIQDYSTGVKADSHAWFVGTTDQFAAIGNVFDTCGWDPTPKADGSPTVGAVDRHHLLYCAGDNGDVIIQGNIFRRSAADALQARPGGRVVSNYFEDCTIGSGSGVVNGAGPVPTNADILYQDNVYLGNKYGKGGLPLGWAIQVGNCVRAAILGNIIQGDSVGFWPAIRFLKCHLDDNDAAKGTKRNPDWDKPIGLNDVLVKGNYCDGYKAGMLGKVDAGASGGGKNTFVGSMTLQPTWAFPKPVDLRSITAGLVDKADVQNIDGTMIVALVKQALGV